MRRNALLLAAASSLALAACGGAPMPSSEPSAASLGEGAPPSAGYAQPGYPMQPGVAMGAAAPSTMGGPAPVAMASAAPREEMSPAPGGAKVAASSEPITIAPAGVRAGEWDDNANYRDFLGYIKNAQSLGIDKLQVSSRRFLVIEDKDGNGVPNCKVTISDPASQKSATLTTAASGRAVLFPHGSASTAPSSPRPPRASRRTRPASRSMRPTATAPSRSSCPSLAVT